MVIFKILSPVLDQPIGGGELQADFAVPVAEFSSCFGFLPSADDAVGLGLVETRGLEKGLGAHHQGDHPVYSAGSLCRAATLR